MDPWGDVLQSLLLLSSLCGLACGVEHDGCRNYSRPEGQVFSVPGEVAMLSSNLLSPEVFNLSAEPYNVTWYKLHSEQPISNQSGRVLVVQESLWFLNVTAADAGDYVTVVRTPQQCFRQETKLVVDLPLSQCGRPRTCGQWLNKGMNDRLSCPLKGYVNKLRSYGVASDITWYKGCEQISDGTDRFHYSRTSLNVKRVESADQGLYTCTLRFSLGGVRGGVSETIDAEVKGDLCQLAQVREPAKDVVRAELGSNVTKRCLVFVPCEGRPQLDSDVYWLQKEYVLNDPKQRIYATEERIEWQDGGALIERWLVISELKEEDLNLNYTCKVLTSRGFPSSYFTLLQKEPELLIPVSLLLGSCLLLFLLAVSVYHVFKLELVLWFRGTFPTLYSSSASDGKLYDAYVAYPQRCAMDWTLEVERFALHTLPQVLEEACGYSLFIPDRDSLPGEAVMDSVEENLKVSRRIILLYTASTFRKRHCSNNNTLLLRPMDQTDTDHLNTSKDHLNSSKDHLNSSKDHVNSGKNHQNSGKDHQNSGKDHQNSSKDHLNSSKDHQNSSKDHLNSSKDDLNSSKDHLNSSKDDLNSSKDHQNSSKDHLNLRKDRLCTSMDHLRMSEHCLCSSKDHLNSSKDHLNSSKDQLNSSKDQLYTSKDQVVNSMNHLNTSKDHLHLNSSKKHLNSSKDRLNSSVDQLNTSMNHLNLSNNHLNSSKNHHNSSVDNLNTWKTDIITTNNNLNTMKDQMSSTKVHFSSNENPKSDCQSCGDSCGHARTHLECVAAMHRALLERSLKVILVELEELGPSAVDQLPESVRHLRQTQGAVCWWRTRGTVGAPWTTKCIRRTGDTETTLSSCVSPDCRFWKEVRYRMPVKGKKIVPPEATTLLQLNGTESRTQKHNELSV